MMGKKTQSRKKGDRAERRVCWYLRFRGYHILARNFCFGHKEIDIIAKKGDVIAFVEVKARASAGVARPYQAVNSCKRYNVITAAQAYIMQNEIIDRRIRFDIAEVDIATGKVNHIANAYNNSYGFN